MGSLMNAFRRFIPVLVVAACWPVASLTADEEDARRALQVEKQRVEETLRLAKAEARTYDISVGSESKMKLDLDERSILRWTNPSSDEVLKDEGQR